MDKDTKRKLYEKLDKINVKDITNKLDSQKKDLEKILSSQFLEDLIESIRILKGLKEYHTWKTTSRIEFTHSGNYYYVYSYVDEYVKEDNRNVPKIDKKYGRIPKDVFEANKEEIERYKQQRDIEKLKKFIEPLQNK